MAHTPRERLAKLLGDGESPGAFSAQLLLPADSLHLEVKGIGQIRLPVRAPQARKSADLHAATRASSARSPTAPSRRFARSKSGPAPDKCSPSVTAGLAVGGG